MDTWIHARGVVDYGGEGMARQRSKEGKAYCTSNMKPNTSAHAYKDQLPQKRIECQPGIFPRVSRIQK